MIIGASAGGEEVGLPRAPSHSLHSGDVVLQSVARLSPLSIPDVEDVVVATRCELSAIGAPFQATHFLIVSLQSSNVMIGDSNIVIEDARILATTGEDVSVPSQSSNTSTVT